MWLEDASLRSRMDLKRHLIDPISETKVFLKTLKAFPTAFWLTAKVNRSLSQEFSGYVFSNGVNLNKVYRKPPRFIRKWYPPHHQKKAPPAKQKRRTHKKVSRSLTHHEQEAPCSTAIARAISYGKGRIKGGAFNFTASPAEVPDAQMKKPSPVFHHQQP